MMNSTGKKAIGLLSGGLDSTIAAKLMLEQEIEVYAINFISPFCTCTPKSSGCATVMTAVKELGGIALKRVTLKDEYLEMVCNPRHGYGRGMNPCIDCRIMKIRKAGEYMRDIGASFLFTGEVLGQRPMSQYRRAIEIIDRESGFKGYTLRPLSAAHFEPTIPEQEGLIDRERLLDISGRSRKIQISLAAEKGIRNYPCPAGGCLLTDRHFSDRLRDYFRYKEYPSVRDIPLLKIGRHFRLENGDKVIVARNEHEGKMLKALSREKDHLFLTKGFSGPVALFQGGQIKSAIDKILEYTRKPVNKKGCILHRYMGKETMISVHEISKY